MKKLNQWITAIAGYIQHDQEIDPECYAYFIDHPEAALQVIDVIAGLKERNVDTKPARYTACLFVLDICIAKLQTSYEAGSKQANKMLHQVMSHLAEKIDQNRHSLSFWLPILNAFYDVHTELSPELKDAYFRLANQESTTVEKNSVTHLSSIRDLIHELGDLSVFDIAENFFAQSYAMPPDFFIDLVLDLYQIEEGHDIALLTLLHPNPAIRDIVVSTLDSLMPSITLSSVSLSRLQMMQYWYPEEHRAQFNHWIVLQRKKGVVFHRAKPARIVQLKTSEVDGGGAQGVFIHIRRKKQNRLAGLLFKRGLGIKDAWVTPDIPQENVRRYYDETFDESVVLRIADVDYLELLVNHFLAETLAHGGLPNLHFLEIQEELGLHFLPRSMDIEAMMQSISVQISPFTTEVINRSLMRSKRWFKTKTFADSWFIENATIDKLVNQCSGFVGGVKICELEKAANLVFEEFERHREDWLFHFFWVTLWLRCGLRKNEIMWQDSFFIAHMIAVGEPLRHVPLMEEICKKSVLNSIDTMQDRRTYLS